MREAPPSNASSRARSRRVTGRPITVPISLGLGALSRVWVRMPPRGRMPCLDQGTETWTASGMGHLSLTSDTGDLDRLNYFLESGSDRIGALDFQKSATKYTPRVAGHQAGLSELVTAADRA